MIQNNMIFTYCYVLNTFYFLRLYICYSINVPSVLRYSPTRDKGAGW